MYISRERKEKFIKEFTEKSMNRNQFIGKRIYRVAIDLQICQITDD